MRTELTVAAAAAAALFAAYLVAGSAQATPLPVLKGDISQSDYGYGYGYGGCGWLYRNAVATGDAYWWNRYYSCTGYY